MTTPIYIVSVSGGKDSTAAAFGRPPPAGSPTRGWRWDHNATYLSHEATHVVWPTAAVMMAPELEWDEGMIPFEMAWLKKLFGDDPIGLAALGEHELYAFEGAPFDYNETRKCTVRAKRVVTKYHLPNPWRRR